MARHQVWDINGNLIVDEEQPESEVAEPIEDRVAKLEAKIKVLEEKTKDK